MPSSFVLIAIVPSLEDATELQEFLKEERIESLIKEEVLVGVDSNITGDFQGFSLHVKEEDRARAAAILENEGVDVIPLQEPSILWKKLDSVTSKWPWIKTWRIGYRIAFAMLLLGSAFALVVFSPIYLTRVDFAKEMNGERFDLQSIHYYTNEDDPKGSAAIVATRESGIKNARPPVHPYDVFCIWFRANGSYEIVGFCDSLVRGTWNIRGDDLFLSDTDTLADIFDGEYDMDLMDGELEIENENTQMICPGAGYQLD